MNNIGYEIEEAALMGLSGLAVRPRLLSEEIYTTLRTAIIEERLPPGMKIVEERLATELGVSRIPLREALHKLERDGFVESLAHRGFRVTAFTPDDVLQIYEIREMLELPAAVKAVDGLTDANLLQLDATIQAMQTAAEGGDEIALVGLHIRFHRLIYDAGNNARLVDLLGPFMELGFTFQVARRAVQDGWARFIDDHQRLVDALRSRDRAAVTREMVIHLERGREMSLATAKA